MAPSFPMELECFDFEFPLIGGETGCGRRGFHVKLGM